MIFSRAHGGNALPTFLPRLSIETTADPDELAQLWARTCKAWESLGEKRPYQSVLDHDRYAPARFAAYAPQFWRSGEDEAKELAGYLDALGARLAEATLIDYGCGVGRLTVPLAGMAGSVIGYDISERHLAIARARAEALGRSNIRTVAIGETLPEALAPCDIFFSRIVLQHNPPPIIGAILRRLIRALERGGIGIFQVPIHLVGYRFSVREALAAPQKLDMDMHCYPQAELLALIAEEGARLIALREDNAPGRPDLFVSNTFVLTKGD